MCFIATCILFQLVSLNVCVSEKIKGMLEKNDKIVWIVCVITSLFRRTLSVDHIKKQLMENMKD